MIPSSKRLAALVVAASAALHLVGIGSMNEPKMQMKGGTDQAAASLGSSFDDLSEGVMQPVKAQPLKAERLDVPSKPALTAATKTHAPPVRATIKPKATAAALPPIVPLSPAVNAADALPPQVTPTRSPPVEVALMPDAARSQRVESSEVEPPVTSLRPRQRPESSKRKQEQLGNADHSARAGQDAGRVPGRKLAAQTEKPLQTAQSGNADADSYAGQVMRRLSRVPRPRVSVQATATVSFSITANGALSWVRISRSSGSQELDSAALSLVRKAAPFPAPPAGARMEFNIRIEGR